MDDPFKLHGPAIISFSGGRTSAYMLWRILQAHGGALPGDVKVAFANTGKELPATLDFVRDCGERWGVDIAWLEYRDHPTPTERWQRVSYQTASRSGEPFKALIDRRQFLSNPVTRFCTVDLKIRPARDFARSLGWERWTVAIGFRADEMHRVVRSQANRERWTNTAPLAIAGITKVDVSSFWLRQNWRLNLPSINGTTLLGNCDLCFLKSAATIMGTMRDRPDLATWWIEAEAASRASKPVGARFRDDRPGYAAMLGAVRDQRDLFIDADMTLNCNCIEDAA